MGALTEGKGEDPANASAGGKGRKGQTKKGGASKGQPFFTDSGVYTELTLSHGQAPRTSTRSSR